MLEKKIIIITLFLNIYTLNGKKQKKLFSLRVQIFENNK